MEKAALSELVKRIRESHEIRIETIPDIELYMEQMLTFLNQRLDSPGKTADTPIFTKTMINNYTKDRLLIPPKNKKYSKHHMMLLILIYHLKGILSISDIKQLFAPVLQDINTPEDDLIPLEDIYTTYLDLTENYLTEFGENFSNKLSFITNLTSHLEGEANHVARLFLTVLVLIAQADLSKKVAELIIEGYFTNPATSDELTRMAYNIDLDSVFGQNPRDSK